MKKARTSYHHGSLRAELLKVAFHLVEKEGIGALSIRKVSKAAGVTHAAPYAHFKDKDQIVAALKELCFQELYDELLKGSTAVKDSEKKLLAIGSAYVHFQLENPSKFQIMFRNPMKEADPDRPDVKIGILIFQLLVSAMEKYLGSKEKAEARALSAWAMVHGLVSLWIEGPMGYIAGIDHRQTKAFEQRAEKLMRDYIRSSF